MPLTPTVVRVETDRQLRRLRIRAGDDIRRLRLEAGATLTEISRVTGIDRSHLRRIESGEATPSLDALVAVGVALGADLSTRYFGGAGPRLVDRFQARMIEAFLGKLHQRWTVRLEVPVTTPHRGVVDAALFDGSSRLVVASEFQSEFRRLEQEIRWNAEKADGLAARLAEEEESPPATVSRIVVVRSTTSTREVGRRYEATLRTAYPSKTRDVVEALTTAASPWPGPGLVWMRLEGARAELLDGPPRGVRLGR